MQVYVDDPAIVVRRPRAFRRTQVAILIIAWRLLGVNLAIQKGQLGMIADWVGITVSVHARGVLASIQHSRIQEIKQLAHDIVGKNVIGLKELRSFTGKCQSVASLLFMWRPCVHMFYGAI